MKDDVMESELTTRGAKANRARLTASLVLAGIIPGLGGCITVNAPEKPIVIELNINIRQEVVYRLAEDVRENINANPDIF